jgi:hypothetical protein
MDQQPNDQHLFLTDLERPAVLHELTKTQNLEIQSQFDEGDRKGFDWRAESFGWTPEQANEVWSWFEQGHRAVEMLKTVGAAS